MTCNLLGFLGLGPWGLEFWAGGVTGFGLQELSEHRCPRPQVLKQKGSQQRSWCVHVSTAWLLLGRFKRILGLGFASGLRVKGFRVSGELWASIRLQGRGPKKEFLQGLTINPKGPSIS